MNINQTIKKSFSRAAMTLLATILLSLTAQPAWADDVTLQTDDDIAEGTVGHYYVNMPATGTNTLTLTDATITSFKVYDDGGKDGNYSKNCSGALTLTAPSGYVFQLSGSVHLDKGPSDKLTIYDGSTTSSTILGEEIDRNGGVSETVIKTVTSTDKVMTIYFYSDYGDQNPGLDLTVRLVSTSTVSDLIVNNPGTGGSVAASVSGNRVNQAKVNDVVTLTASPASGYMLNDLDVKDANGYVVNVSDMLWYTGNSTATFSMPGLSATVTPTFTNNLSADGGLYINMPATGSMTVNIPSDVTSFKVYDDGGKDGNYSYGEGFLVLNAPEGYILQLSGSTKLTMGSPSDKFWVYDGDYDANSTPTLNHVGSSSFDPVISTGNRMTLRFKTTRSFHKAGLDLTVTLIASAKEFDISCIDNVTGGSIISSVGGSNVNKAKFKDVVTLTATPESGYFLRDLSVKDASGNAVAVDWNIWTNTATFTMPYSTVTVTPTFTNNLSVDGELYINMPQTGHKTATFPSGVTSFKVYDDGGKEGNYSYNCSGSLTLNCPTGYSIQLSGGITSEIKYDKLTVYDGNSMNANVIGEFSTYGDYGYDTPSPIPTLISSGQSMTLYFFSDDINDNRAGLDLTVTLVDLSIEYEISGIGNVAGGIITATVGGESVTKAKPNDVVTLTATPASGYMFNDLIAVNGENNTLTSGGWYSSKQTTFTMPPSVVTVRSAFCAEADRYINMAPEYGTISAVIPSGVTSFKVYDEARTGTPTSFKALYI